MTRTAMRFHISLCILNFCVPSDTNAEMEFGLIGENSVMHASNDERVGMRCTQPAALLTSLHILVMQ